jgi:drug/metabolite transporter superfamily protein YnfA
VTKPSETQRRAWTVGLLSLVSTIAVFLTDLGFVNSFGGALIASGIIYVFPAMMFLAPLRKKVRNE